MPHQFNKPFISRDVMLRGGNSIDSAVATMYCNSVINSQGCLWINIDYLPGQSMGLGGGFIMTIYPSYYIYEYIYLDRVWD